MITHVRLRNQLSYKFEICNHPTLTAVILTVLLDSRDVKEERPYSAKYLDALHSNLEQGS